MAEPLDYRNPNQPADPVSSPTSLQQPIPIEFDSVLIQTADFSAARAIEVALRRNKIAAHVAKIGTGLKQQIEIYVRKDAHERAWQIAGKILARRQKL